jgi:Uma2 family endonuclease
MSKTTDLVTADELERFPRDDRRYELVDGRVIPMSPVNFQHGKVVLQFGFLLSRYLRSQPVGVVVAEVGFKLAFGPDTVRAPDIAFIRADRLPAPNARGFFTGPPDLAIEVLSPDDRPADVRAKVDQYLARGVALVVVIDPGPQTVTTWRPTTPAATLHTDEVLDLSDVIAGFRCSVREIFLEL